jgi:hypothetical protein
VRTASGTHGLIAFSSGPADVGCTLSDDHVGELLKNPDSTVGT